MRETVKLRSTEGSPHPPTRFELDTIPQARQAVADLINARNDEMVEDAKYRSLVWGLSQLLAFFRLEKDLQIEERLDELEAALEANR